MELPKPSNEPLPDIKEILNSKRDKAKGKIAATACLTCHKIGNEGVDYGPDITTFASSQPAEVVLKIHN